jgi:hypothetical protein
VDLIDLQISERDPDSEKRDEEMSFVFHDC